MDNSKVIALALMFSAVGFFAARWASTPAEEPMPVFRSIDVNSPEEKYRASYASDNDKTRDALRHAVLQTANDLAKNACDSGNSYRYIQAANNYARAWIAAAPPCVNTNSCMKFTPREADQVDRQLKKVQKEFGTPLDHRAREAMLRAHEAAALEATDFPPDLVSIVTLLARDTDLNPQPGHRSFRRPPRCSPGTP